MTHCEDYLLGALGSGLRGQRLVVFWPRADPLGNRIEFMELSCGLVAGSRIGGQLGCGEVSGWQTRLIRNALKEIPVVGEAVGGFEVVQIEFSAAGPDELEHFFHSRTFVGKSAQPVGDIGSPVHAAG